VTALISTWSGGGGVVGGLSLAHSLKSAAAEMKGGEGSRRSGNE